MIKQITLDTLDDLTDLITDYLQFLKDERGRPPSPLKEQLKELLSEKARVIFALYQKNQVLGFATASPSEGIINVIHIQKSIKERDDSEALIYEKKLFNAAFTYLKADCSTVRIFGIQISDNLANYVVKNGFKNIKRAKMFIERESIESLVEPDLPSEYKFVPWNVDLIPFIADLLAMYHFNGDQHPDAEVFPQFAGIEGAKRLIEGIRTNKYGQFKEDYTVIIKHNEKCIGANFMTLFPEFGYIPEIIVSPEHRGKGLGKGLLIHSLKQFIKKEPDISRVELDVTLKNIPAARAYKSLGFQERDQYSVFIWNKE
ncbi:MAG: GNAT family N-acetyltransferase [Candidatus Hermodarchaeota archaeon]